jgi:hypothetical protein
VGVFVEALDGAGADGGAERAEQEQAAAQGGEDDRNT